METLLAKSLLIFSHLAVEETAASLSTTKMECGGSRNAAAAKSLKKTSDGDIEVMGE